MKGLRRRSLRDQAARLVALGILTAVIALAAVAAPRLTTTLVDADLHRTVASAPAPLRDLVATVDASSFPNETANDSGEVSIVNTWGAIPSALASASKDLPGDLRRITKPGRFTGVASGPTRPGLSAGFTASETPDAPIGVETLSVEAYPSLRDDATLVSGRWPRPDAEDPARPLEAVVTASAAKSLGWHVGQVQTISAATATGGLERGVLLVGTIRPQPGAEYWELDGSRARMGVELDSQNTRFNHAVFWVDPTSWPVVAPRLGGVTISAWVPVDGTKLSSSGSPSVQAALAKSLSSPVPIDDRTGDDRVLRFGTTLGGILTAFSAKAAASSSILSLATVGPLGVAFLTLLLTVRLLLDDRSRVRALVRSRGAPVSRLVRDAAADVAVASVPGALVGSVVATVAVPQPLGVDDVVIALLCALVPPVLACLVILIDEELPTSLRRGFSSRRLVFEGLLVLLAIAVVVIVLGRASGTSAASGVDPLVTLSPLVIAGAAIVLVLRLVPAVVGLLRRASQRSRRAASFVGTSSALRAAGNTGWIVAAALSTTAVGVLCLVLVTSEEHRPRIAAATGRIGRSVSPLVAGIPAVVLLGVLLAVLLATGAFAVALLAETPARRRRAGSLRMLGFRPPEIGRVTVWVLAPAVLAGVVVGAAAGLATASFVLPAVDPFRLPHDRPVPIVVDWKSTLLVLLALVLAASVASLLAVLSDRRHASSTPVGRTTS